MRALRYRRLGRLGPRFGQGAVIAMGLLIGFSAHAVLPPELYRDARREADHHVQVAVSDVAVPSKTPGSCTVTGTVVTIFRSAGAVLAVGTKLRFDVACARTDDDVPVGGTLWQNVWHLERARFIEAYLMGDAPPDVWVARWQSTTIPEPSKEPHCPVDAPGFTCN